MSQLIENLKSARASGVPLVAVVSQDQPATVAAIEAGLPGNAPSITWDCINGLRALNDGGKSALVNLGDVIRDSGHAVMALKACLSLPGGTIVFLFNAHAVIGERAAVQGIANLREPFKENKRTLILLGPSFADMRPELQSDVVVLEEPMPSDAQLSTLIADLHESAGKPLDKARLPSMLDAVRGLPALFTAEQVIAMSFRKSGLDLDALWSRKVAAINATPGLKISRGGRTFADLAGMDVIQQFLTSIQSGPRPFSLVLFLDEIEKMMAGSGGEQTDSSGVSSDQLSVILDKMESLRWRGILLFGVPGSGKTATAEATAGEFDVPRIKLDLGAMKGQYVGTSEQRIRTAFSVVEGLGGSEVLVIATCNRMRTLPSELRRRFGLTTPWFFDVPTLDEQQPIKALYEKKLGLTRATHGEWPNTTGWTGAEIRNCAELAVMRASSLVEAGEYIVPIATSDPESVEQMRQTAEGRFLSVSQKGKWTRERQVMATKAGKRSIG